MEQEAEIWKPVVGYEGLYEVSSLGRVRSYHKYWAKGRTTILRSWISYTGYPAVGLIIYRKRKTTNVHVIVAEAFLGPRPPGCVINHKDFDKANCAAYNLEYITHLENMEHATLHRRFRRGAEVPGSKLNEDAVREIRALAEKVPQRLIARRFGICQQTVCEIIRREIWKHIPD